MSSNAEAARERQLKDYEEENRSRRAAYEKAYRARNRERLLQKGRAYYQANREAMLARFRANYQRRKEQIRAKQNASLRARRAELKFEVIGHYSGGSHMCACCGETEPRFLTLDHINGGGNKHRREVNQRGIGLYRLLRAQGYPRGFQVLCMNCNLAKSAYSTCPHQRHEEARAA